MSKAKTVDLTSGPILKNLAELALPIMVSSMLGTAYSIMDMAWIGLLGAKAVAGVGVGGMYVWLSQGLAAMPRMGGQVNVAQACGRKDYEQARSYAACSLQLTVLFGILFAAVCVIFINPLLGFFHLTGCGDLCFCEVLYLDHLWADSVFFSESDSDWAFHRAGGFQNSSAGKFYRACRKYASGPVTDPWCGTFSKAGNCRCCDCDGDFPDAGFCGNDHKDQALPAGA